MSDRIDNLADLVKDLGPEGYLSIIRDFTPSRGSNPQHLYYDGVRLQA